MQLICRMMAIVGYREIKKMFHLGTEDVSGTALRQERESLMTRLDLFPFRSLTRRPL